MKTAKRIVIGLLITAVILAVLFLMGRYGWKLGGFSACENAGIESVEVSDNSVRITGFFPGSFPEGFCGYYAEEQDGTLFVGFQFSAVFGFFETGDFDITIPVKGEIHQVAVKTRNQEYVIWDDQWGMRVQSEQYGVYVKLERNDVCAITMSCDYSSGGLRNADYTAMETGEYFYMDNDIMIYSKETEAPVPFTLAAVAVDGSELVSGEFTFDASMEKMYLTVTADGRIVEDRDYEP